MKKIVLTQEKIVDKNYDEPFIDIVDFEKNLDIQILFSSADKIHLLIDHIDTPIANALRRIMIADIPTMAIHKVSVIQNTSVIPDEVLAHRIGLIPIQADPRLFQFKKEQDDYNERNSIKFTLHVKCTRKQEYKDQKIDAVITDPEKYFNNSTVYASDLQWNPQGNQTESFTDVKAIHPDIIIAKLRENQEIYLEIICEKGIGKQHAKWSPVATAYYKLMPQITIKPAIRGQEALRLKKLCPVGVFDIENDLAVVAMPINCTSCRECIREENNFNKNIELAKTKDKFIFIIESVGMYQAHEIFLEAIEILKRKVLQYKNTKH